MYWGAGRECRYSQARKGIGSIRGYWRSPRGVGVLGAVKRHQMGVSSVFETGRECRYSRVRRGIGSIRGHWGSPRGCRGVGTIKGIRV